ncbi:MAG TPA: ABC transporter permease [Terriglobales bacterium]
MGTLLSDVRYGLRMLAKNPGFTAVAALTLALGIGANTAIFSVVNAVLLQPLPYDQPDRLVSVVSTMLPSNRDANASYPDFLDWRARNHVFEGLAAFDTRGFTLTGTGTALRLNGAVVSADLFRLLGVNPALGRWFLPEEDKPGADQGTDAVILSQALWKRQFGSDAQVIGRTVQLDGKPFVIAGVMPGSFQFPPPPQTDSPELWTTIAVDAEAPGGGITTERGAHYLDVMARLKPGITVTQAEAEMRTIAGDLNKQFPENHPRGAKVLPELSELAQNVRPALLILLGAVGCVLLIACANVANLLLARGTARQREIAIRSALGASRGRVMRQVLTECVVLSCLGGALGLLLAIWGIDLLVRVIPEGVPRLSEIGLDARLLVFAVVVSLLTGLLFGLVPAVQGSKTDLTEALKEGARGASEGVQRSRVRSTLVVGEVAIAMVLLVGAGLLMKSFVRLERVDPGFKADHVLTFGLQPPSTYDIGRRQQFFRQVVARIHSSPGVRSASAVTPLPLGGDEADCGFQIEGSPVPEASAPNTHYTAAEPDYFRTMGIPFLQGRDFTPRDDLETTPVIIINQTLAELFFPGQNPIGQRIKPGIGNGYNEPPMREIVGVVGDVKPVRLNGPRSAQVYVPMAQSPSGSVVIVARTATDPATIASAARDEVKALDKDVPVFAVKALDEYVGDSVSESRFTSRLLGSFAGLALILAAVGIYGVISYSVTQRTHEIGVRIALGAGLGDVLKLVVGQGVRLALAGIGIGAVAALGMTRLLRTMLFGVQPSDPLTFALVSSILCAAALLATYVPARRATKVDPMVALRYE